MNLVEQIANCFPTQALSAETLITNCGYFMPGWMTVSILDCKAAGVIPHNLIYWMAEQSDDCFPRTHSFYGSLSLRQLKCVSQFIEWYNGGQDWTDEETKVAWTRIQHWIFAESARCDRFIRNRTKRLRFLSQQELERLTVSRLLAYRNKALSLESKPVELGPTDCRDLNDIRFIWFKQDPRWDGLYERILGVLNVKQAVSFSALA